MEFCDICDNMLYMRTGGKTNNLIQYCKNCKSSKQLESNDPNRKPYKISHTLYTDDDLLYLQHQNKYLRFDPTLPRVCDANLRCPDEKCALTKAGEPSRLLYLKYHPTDLKYLYCCDHCGYCGLYEEFQIKK